MGFVALFLSDPLISGFTTGAAVYVFSAQIKYFFGIDLQRHSAPFSLAKVSNLNISSSIQASCFLTDCTNAYLSQHHPFIYEVQMKFCGVKILLITKCCGQELAKRPLAGWGYSALSYR